MMLLLQCIIAHTHNSSLTQYNHMFRHNEFANVAAAISTAEMLKIRNSDTKRQNSNSRNMDLFNMFMIYDYNNRLFCQLNTLRV